MAKKKKNEESEKALVSMDEEIGKGLTPKDEKPDLKSSQFEKDYEKHSKFSKFKGEG